MSDKVTLIKREIERRTNLLKNGEADLEVMKRVEGVLLAYNSILEFINSLPEEPASEDLSEEIERWIKEKRFIFTEIDEVTETAHHFAEWQKQKDQETIELAEDHAMLAGMEKMREEMMKDAVDATILDVDAQTIEFGLWPEKLLNIKEGNKVKLIIIKED